MRRWHTNRRSIPYFGVITPIFMLLISLCDYFKINENVPLNEINLCARALAIEKQKKAGQSALLRFIPLRVLDLALRTYVLLVDDRSMHPSRSNSTDRRAACMHTYFGIAVHTTPFVRHAYDVQSNGRAASLD
jgi:hypothetical protein